MECVLVPAGSFEMGNGAEKSSLPERFPREDVRSEFFTDEYPCHYVEISEAFYLGRYEVTVEQFAIFVSETKYTTDAETSGEGAMGYNGHQWEYNSQLSWRSPGFVQTGRNPVVCVSWNDANAFCEWLSHKEGRLYSLPTEAQWEYAARGTTRTHYVTGNTPESLQGYANVADRSFSETIRMHEFVNIVDGYVFTAPVGAFRPNAFGLYDMTGNVSEWCADWYDSNYYQKSPVKDPHNKTISFYRIVRGGV
jgi:formylglycine-generating enzyme required for sulfatase activity